MKNLVRKAMLTLICPAAFIALASFTAGGDDPVVSNTKIVNGQTAGVASKKEFNAGEEIYACIPLKAPMGDKIIVRLEADGKDLFSNDILCYTSENKLNYLSFAIAIDPKNHYPEQYYYKEGHYQRSLKALSELAPGKYKISFGTAPGLAMKYTGFVSFTLNVTADGQKKWKEWAEEVERMDKEYDKKQSQ